MESATPLEEEGSNSDVVVEIRAQNGDSEFRQEAGPFMELSNLEMVLLASTSNASPQPNNPTTQAPPSASSAPIPPSSDPSAKPPIGPAMRQRNVTKSAYSKPNSRVAEPPYPFKAKPVEGSAQVAPATARSPLIASSPIRASPSPKTRPVTPKTPVSITPRTPLMASIGGDEDDEVYKPERTKKGIKVKVMHVIEWIAFVSLTTVLIVSLTIDELRDLLIWSSELWKWSVLLFAVVCLSSG